LRLPGVVGNLSEAADTLATLPTAAVLRLPASVVNRLGILDKIPSLVAQYRQTGTDNQAWPAE